MADLPSQYAEVLETFRCILILPDPRETMPRSSTSVLGLDNKKGQQELRPRGPSSMLPLSSRIKYAFDKFEHDFLASNLPEGKYINPPHSRGANGPHEGTQISPIPGRLADHVPVSGRTPSEHSGCGRPNPVLGVDNKSGEIRTKTNSSVFVRGL